MESAMMVFPINYASPDESYSKGHKRMKISNDAKHYGCTTSFTSMKDETKEKTPKVPQNIIDYSDPLAISNLLENLDTGRFGSVTKDIKDLIDRKVRTWGPLLTENPLLSNLFVDAEENLSKQASKAGSQHAFHNVIDLEGECVAVIGPSVVVLSDDEDDEDRRPSNPFREVVLMQPLVGNFLQTT